MGLTRAWRRLTSPSEQLEADELREQTRRSGITPIVEAEVGQRVTVAGTIRSISIQPQQSLPALQAQLFDGTGAVTVIWLGRRRIIGVEPGRRMVVCGRLTMGSFGPTIFNPQYELKPGVA